MAGFSDDPAKKRRQMEALAANNPAVRRKLDAGEYDFGPAAEPAAAGTSPVNTQSGAGPDQAGRTEPAGTRPPAVPRPSAPQPAQTTTVGGVPVVGYQEPKHEPRTEPARAAGAAPEPADGPEPAPEPHAEPEPRRGALGAFWEGFTGG